MQDDKKIGEINIPALKKEATSSARKLLARPPESSYIDQWSQLLVRQKDVVQESTERSVVLFRLGTEWLAIPASVFTEVSSMRFIHAIPHRSGGILAGLVNLRGQLVLCANLHRLLDIDSHTSKDEEKNRRMLTIQRNGERWIFAVDELFGIFHCQIEHLENVPVTVAKSTANYLKGVFSHKKRSVGLLDEELLFFSLRRRAL